MTLQKSHIPQLLSQIALALLIIVLSGVHSPEELLFPANAWAWLTIVLSLVVGANRHKTIDNGMQLFLNAGGSDFGEVVYYITAFIVHFLVVGGLSTVAGVLLYAACNVI